MRSFKPWLKNIIKLVCFLVLVALLINVLNLSVNIASYDYCRLMMNSFYEQSVIDVVFAGSSNMQFSLDPRIFDNVLGMETFNIGSPAQVTKDTYYLLKEAFRLYSPQYVLFYPQYIIGSSGDGAAFGDGFYYNDTLQVGASHILDYMKWSPNKIDYMFHAVPADSLEDALFPSYRSRDTASINTLLFNVDTLQKIEAGELNTIISTPGIEYSGKGYWSHSHEYLHTDYGESRGSYGFTLYEQPIAGLEEIIELCRENGAQLIFVIPPFPTELVFAVDNYEKTYDYATYFNQMYGIELWDFNMTRAEYLTKTEEMFFDRSHMNDALATPFSELCAKLLKEYIDTGGIDKDEYFYSSFEEYYDSIDRVVSTRISDLNSYTVTAESVAANNEVEYRFSYMIIEEGDSFSDDDFILIRDYDTNPTASLPAVYLEGAQQCFIRVDARVVGSQDDFEQLAAKQLVI